MSGGAVDFTRSGKLWTDNFEAGEDQEQDSDYISRVYLNSLTCDTSDDSGNRLGKVPEWGSTDYV